MIAFLIAQIAKIKAAISAIVASETPVECAITFAEQENYTLSNIPGYNKVLRCGKVVTVQMCIECTTAYSDYPGLEFVSAGVPVPKLGSYFFSVIPSANFLSGRPMRVSIEEGKIYLRHGEAGKQYEIAVVYFCE